jgi:hypothetical protein
MRPRDAFLALAAPLIAALVLVAPPALESVTASPRSSGYDLSWNTVDGGGRSSGGGYFLAGALGQAAASRLIGGGYSLSGGFLAGAVNLRAVYLPLVVRGQ